MKNRLRRRTAPESGPIVSVQEVRAKLVPATVFPLIVTRGSPFELNDRIEIWLNEGGAGGEVNR